MGILFLHLAIHKFRETYAIGLYSYRWVSTIWAQKKCIKMKIIMSTITNVSQKTTIQAHGISYHHLIDYFKWIFKSSEDFFHLMSCFDESKWPN